MSKVIASGDKHFPFASQKMLNRFYKYLKKQKPDYIIDMGDIGDQFMFARFDKDLNVISPDKELKKFKKEVSDYWKTVSNICPNAKRIQLLGNHDVRILKKCLSSFPEAYSLIKEIHEDLYKIPGVEVMKTDKDFITIDEVVYTHGWMSTHTSHFGKSVVRAHDHKAWIKLERSNKTSRNLVFEVSCGCFGDQQSVPLSYPSSKFTGWEAAAVEVVDGYPRLIVL